jgi:hypothetical protein
MAKCQIDFNNTIDWEINPDVFNKIIKDDSKNGITLKDTLFKEYEYAGAFTFEFNNDHTCKNCHKVEIKDLTKGNKSSVKTTSGLINFHVHPFACYRGECTCWGWCSGEDMREAIIFKLKGNICHFVFTLEGIYTLQVDPKVLYFLDELKSDTRGSIIAIIETYFKATHGHRTVNYNKNIDRCNPEDWVKFANNFTLENLFSKKNKCNKKLPCAGFPNDEEGGNISAEEYLKLIDVGNYILNNNWNLSMSSKKLNVKSIKNHPHFEKVKWFNVQLIPNTFTFNGKHIELHQLQKKDPKEIFKFWERCEKEKLNKHKKNDIHFPTKQLSFKFYSIKNSGKCLIRHTNELRKYYDKRLKDTKKNHFKR